MVGILMIGGRKINRYSEWWFDNWWNENIVVDEIDNCIRWQCGLIVQRQC